MDRKLIQKKMLSCDHIWMVKDKPEIIKKCLKCSLSDSVFKEKSILDNEDKIMMTFILNNSSTLLKGKSLGLYCDFNIGEAIYKRLVEKYKDIDDEKIRKYMNAALYNIENKKNESKKEKLIKRLKLDTK